MKLRQATREKRKAMKAWERKWWESLSQEAEDAARRNDQGTLYKILGQLQSRGAKRRKDGGTNTVGDLEKEREAWRQHFEKVSLTPGRVPDKVWDNVPEVNQKTT